MIISIIELSLIYLCLSQWPPTTKFSLYTTDQLDDFYMGIIAQQCISAPLTTLNLCSTRCQQCFTSNSNKCSLCTSQFNIDVSECVLDKSIHEYQVYQYLGSNNQVKMKEEISTFIDVNNNQTLMQGMVIYTYRYNGYRMLLAGLFTAEDKIGIRYNFQNSIDQIQIRLRFISIIHDHLFVIQANQKIIYQKQFTFVTDLGGQYLAQYQKGTRGQLKAFLQVHALEAATASNIMILADTGVKEIVTKDLTLSFHVKTKNINQEYKNFWGFNDIIIVKRRCQTCVQEEVIVLIKQMVQICYISGAVLGFLFLVLTLLVYVEGVIRKNKVKVKMGLVEEKKSFSGDNLPERAIKRLFIAIEKNKKGIIKDQKIRQLAFKRAIKRK